MNNKESHNLYSSHNILRVMKSRRRVDMQLMWGKYSVRTQLCQNS
jgi:hypothetical protein